MVSLCRRPTWCVAAVYLAPSAMANRARARSTWAAGALSERLRRVSSWRSSAVSGRRGSFRWRDMGHLGARGSPHHYTSSHGRRPTSVQQVNAADGSTEEFIDVSERRRGNWVAEIDLTVGLRRSVRQVLVPVVADPFQA